MKTRNSFYNSLAGLLYYFITILLGIVNRKAVIAFLGIEYQGINSLFGNILSMLSIAEALPGRERPGPESGGPLSHPGFSAPERPRPWPGFPCPAARPCG